LQYLPYQCEFNLCYSSLVVKKIRFPWIKLNLNKEAGDFMQKAKRYYEKMVDYKQFARVMIALSAFLYLGVIIPTVEKNQTDLIIMMTVTTIFLIGSILFLIRSKSYHQKLLNMEEGQEFLIKK